MFKFIKRLFGGNNSENVLDVNHDYDKPYAMEQKKRIPSGLIGNTTRSFDDVYGSLNSNSRIQLTVFNAMGGKLIQSVSYDPVTEQRRETLHIIHDTDNLAEELESILTMTALRK